jgi:hypothetical protein
METRWGFGIKCLHDDKVNRHDRTGVRVRFAGERLACG